MSPTTSAPPVPARSFWREFSIVNVIAAVIAGVVSTTAFIEVTRDPYTDSPLVWMGVLAPAFTAIVISIEDAARPAQFTLNRFLIRLYGLNGIFILATTIAHVVVGWQHAIFAAEAAIDSRQTEPLGILVQGLLGFDLLGYGAALIGGALALIVIVIPVVSMRQPKVFAKENHLSTETAHTKAARLAGIGISVLLLLTFTVPTLIVVGNEIRSEVLVIIGWALVPVGLAALVFTAVVQKPDRERRRRTLQREL